MTKPKSSKATKTRKKTPAKRPLLRRVLYFVLMIMTGGTAGIGGWCFKDYPELQPILALFLGGPGDQAGNGEARPGKLAAAKAVLVDVFSRTPNQPGVYTVRINEVRLDPAQFTKGHTVDIQARVRQVDDQGRESTVWESKTYGENLAVVGRDELSARWSNRPFEIDWRSGDQVIVEVWDRRAGLFSSTRFNMARPAPDAFPLASGTHALEVASRGRSAAESDLNRIVLDSQRSGDSAPRLDAAVQRSGAPRTASSRSEPAPRSERAPAPARRGADRADDGDVPDERPIIIR